MTELEAIHWIQNQPGLIILIDKDRQVTLTNGVTVEVTATGITDAVIKLQEVLKTMDNTKTTTCINT